MNVSPNKKTVTYGEISSDIQIAFLELNLLPDCQAGLEWEVHVFMIQKNTHNTLWDKLKFSTK
jgi:hypothetical protein